MKGDALSYLMSILTGPPAKARPVMAPADATARPIAPESGLVDSFKRWRSANQTQTASAFDPKNLNTPQGNEAMLNLLMGATAGAPKAKGIEAWHGSPAKGIDKFLLSMRGSGEGVAAHGSGIYTAELPEVARSYMGPRAGAEFIGPAASPPPAMPPFRGGGYYTPERFHPDLSSHKAVEAVKATDGNLDLASKQLTDRAAYRRTALRSYMKDAGVGMTPTGIKAEAARIREMDRAVEHIRAGNIRPKPTDASLYRLNLDVTPKELLLHDVPLSQQPEALAAFRRVGYTGDEGVSGREAYMAMSDQLRRGMPEMSAKLKKEGIVGIEYLDQGSRTQRTGTKNYVIFDPKRIKILETLAALGAVSAQNELAAMRGDGK